MHIDQTLVVAEPIKFLDLHVHSHLSWKSHVYNLLKKFSSVMCYDEKIILHTKHTYITYSLL
jgi:hypothetical protein